MGHGTTSPPSSRWFDLVPAAPTIGLRVERQFLTASEYLAKLRTYLEEQGDDTFTLHEGPSMLHLKVDLPTGYSVRFDQDNIVVQYQYAYQKTREAGKLATFTPPDLRAYSDLLSSAKEHALEVTRRILGTRRVLRTGVVLAAELDKGSLPPGVEDYIQGFGVFGDRPVQMINSKVMINLSSEHGAPQDRCHHAVMMNPLDDVVTFTMDWQRTLDTPQPHSGLSRSLSLGIESAIKYFSAFGEGGPDAA